MEERENPDVINGSRKNRIAKGSGRTIQEVNNLLKQFADMRKLMKTMNKMGGGKKALSALNPFGRQN
jgi:signal recognition particle subunit SRP54